MTDCIFCKIIRGELGAEFVHQDEDIVAFRDIQPQAPTHVLVVSRKHIPTIMDCELPENMELLNKMLAVCRMIAKREMIHEKGFRLVINTGVEGGQLVKHLHIHLLGGREMGWPPG
ncbi:MAG: histidine triad nucleotide-binding protein [Candidatus Coatesbacteria bacterium]|nr:histidine triad nucleotide-binding protein [Candidatus Coatesbacteria bacterium]